MFSHSLVNKNLRLKIGTNVDIEEISIPYSTREAHLHVMGRTRSGKSRFLADLIIQDIINGQGLCVLDPHGELYHYVIAWLLRNPISAKYRSLHPVDFNDPSHTFCFNPLAIDRPEEAYSAAELLTETLSRVFGNAATDTPLIDANLNTIFVILAQQGLPLAAALNFIQSDFAAERERIVANHHDPYYRVLGEEFSRIKPDSREWRETMASTERRLRQFLGRPIMREFFSQTQNTISFRQAMDERDVLLFNLKPTKLLGHRQMRALSMLLTGTLVDAAFSRDERGSPQPFFAYLDEVQTMLTDDADRILSECSKFGLFLTASHQYLGQLEHEGSERIKSAIMANTLLKAVFATSQADALEFVDEAFADQIDFERRKESLITPHVVGHRRIRLANEAQAVAYGESSARAESWADGSTSGISIGRSDGHTSGETHGASEGTTEVASQNMGTSDSETFAPASGSDPTLAVGTSLSSAQATGTQSSSSSAVSSSSSRSTSYAASQSRSHSVGGSRSESISKTDAYSWGWGESLEPIIEWFSTQTWTLEEQRYQFAQQIARAPKRHGHFVAVGHGTIPFETRDRPDLPEIASAEAELTYELRERSAWMIGSEDAIDQAAVYQLGDVAMIDEDDDEYFHEV